MLRVYFVVSTLSRKGELWDQIQICLIVGGGTNGLRLPRRTTVTALNHQTDCVPKPKQDKEIEEYKKDGRWLKMKDTYKRFECNKHTKSVQKALERFPIGLKVKFDQHFLLCNGCFEVAAVSHRLPPTLMKEYQLRAIVPHNLIKLEDVISPGECEAKRDDEVFELSFPLFRKCDGSAATMGLVSFTKYTCKRQVSRQSPCCKSGNPFYI